MIQIIKKYVSNMLVPGALFCAISATFLWAPLSAGAVSLKIAYVDMQKALQETTAGKQAKKELERELNKRRKSLDQKKSDLQQKREDIQKKKDLLSQVALQQKAQEFQQEMFKYQEEVQKVQIDMQKKERELTTPIIRQLSKVIDGIAQADKYDMILEKSQQGIVWAKKEMDLTAKVIEIFEKKSKKK